MLVKRSVPIIKEPNIYAVIIGTEILDGRRKDKHFEYLSSALKAKGFHLVASFMIKDDKELIKNIYSLIHQDPEAIMFSFGGIGSTPDDLTRQLSADIFSDGKLYRHTQFEQDIIDRLQERAYPHSIRMSDLPKDAALLFNPINNMSGFHLHQKLFFMPGFPQMAQPMIDHICENFLPEPCFSHTKGFLAQCGEGKLQDLMSSLPPEVELSSLPMMNETLPSVEFRLYCLDEDKLDTEFQKFIDFLDTQQIEYFLL